MSSSPPNASPTSAKTRAMSSSERTSHSVTSGLDDRRGQLADALLDALALVGERELRARRRRAAARSPRRSSACSRRRGRAPRLPSKPPGHRGESTYAGVRYAGPLAPLSRSSRLRGARLGALPASAALEPVRRTFGELDLPRVRAGTIHDPGRARATGRVTRDRRPARCRRSPPRSGRGAVARRRRVGRLDVHSAASRAYLAPARAAQQAARSRELRRAIPRGAGRPPLPDPPRRAHRRRCPRRSCRALVRQLGFVKHVYPSMRYTLATRPQPAVIGATRSRQATRRDRRRGSRSPSSTTGSTRRTRSSTRPASRTRAGFPQGRHDVHDAEGDRRARLPRPGLRRGRASCRSTRRRRSTARTSPGSPPATPARPRRPGPTIPQVTGLSGVAPRAWLGNYRVFNVPTPIGNIANTPEIVAAFEAAVADGMDVINFSGGGPQIDPANDALVEAIHNVAAAGVVPVIAAGNDRDDFGARLRRLARARRRTRSPSRPSRTPTSSRPR